MSDAVLGAIIVAVGSIIVQLLINVSNRAKEHERQSVYRANLENELKLIKSKLDEHNEYGKKFSESSKKYANLEMELKLIGQDIKYIKEGRFNSND